MGENQGQSRTNSRRFIRVARKEENRRCRNPTRDTVGELFVYQTGLLRVCAVQRRQGRCAGRYAVQEGETYKEKG